MTETEKKVLALALEMIGPGGIYEVNVENMSALITTLKAAIEQHEAFRQEVSDAVEQFQKFNPRSSHFGLLAQFIIPKPDPLVEVLQEISGEGGYDNFEHYAYRLRSALEARGLEVRKIEGEGVDTV